MSKHIESLKEGLFEEVRQNLPQGPGWDHTLSVSDIPIYKVEQLLEYLSGAPVEIVEFNGHDQDWSITVAIGDANYSVWGSARRGGFNMSMED
jgi:hypothetical protein